MNVTAVVAKSAKPLVLSESEHKRLTAIDGDINSDKNTLAYAALSKFVAQQHSAYAQALGWQMLGMLDYKTQRQEQAFSHFAKALSFPQLPADNKANIYNTLLQLSYQQKDWQACIDNWWLLQQNETHKTTSQRKAMTANSYLMVSDSYRELQQWYQAKKNLQIALKMTTNPPSNWLQLQWSIERHINTPVQNIALLKQLIAAFALEERYWLALALEYKKSAQSALVNTTLHSAFLNGVLTTPEHILWLAHSLSVQGNPAMAINVIKISQNRGLMQQAPNSQSLLTQLYVKAKMFDAALQGLENRRQHEAGFSDYELLAQLYFKQRRWQETYDSAMQIPDQRSVSQVSIQLLLGISSRKLDKHKVAKTHFLRILELAPNHQIATQALGQID